MQGACSKHGHLVQEALGGMGLGTGACGDNSSSSGTAFSVPTITSHPCGNLSFHLCHKPGVTVTGCMKMPGVSLTCWQSHSCWVGDPALGSASGSSWGWKMGFCLHLIASYGRDKVAYRYFGVTTVTRLPEKLRALPMAVG